MPYLNIVTNQQINDKTALLKTASQTVSEATGKPESYVMISVNDNIDMSFAGSSAPCAFLDYRALGLPSDRTTFADKLCSMIEQALQVEGNRIYISMTDSERQNWGWNHSTF